MAVVTTNNQNYADIASAIREKTGAETTYKPSEMSSGVNEVYDKGYADAQQSEYDKFWDTFQDYGNRRYYTYAFAGVLWSNEMVPKYNITFNDYSTTSRECMGMFSCYNRDRHLGEYADMTEILSKIDFSKCLTATNVFALARVKNVYCDFSSAESMIRTFDDSDGGSVNYIRLKVSEATTKFENTFAYTTKLTDIIFVDGSVIAANISFDRSPLNVESIKSITNALSDSTTDKTVTFKLSAVNTAFETAEGLADGSESQDWLNLIATKENWTFSLV